MSVVQLSKGNTLIYWNAVTYYFTEKRKDWMQEQYVQLSSDCITRPYNRNFVLQTLAEDFRNPRHRVDSRPS